MKRSLPFALLFAASLSSIACTHASDDGTVTETRAPAPTINPSGDSVAVHAIGDVFGARVVATQKDGKKVASAFRDAVKVKHAVELLELRSMTEKQGPAAACDGTRIDFFDAKGAVVAKVGVLCSPGAKNQLEVGGKVFGFDMNFANLPPLREIAPEPKLVANWLFDVSSLTIEEPRAGTKATVESPNDVKRAVEAVSALEPMGTKSRLICQPSHFVRFNNAAGEIARLTLGCSDGMAPDQPAFLEAGVGNFGTVIADEKIIAALARL